MPTAAASWGIREVRSHAGERIRLQTVGVSGLIHHKIHPGIFMQAQGIEYTL